MDLFLKANVLHGKSEKVKTIITEKKIKSLNKLEEGTSRI